MATIQELTNMMRSLVTSKGWDSPQSNRPQTPKNMAVSLCIEASEVLEHFQWGDSVQDKAAFALELADVQLYLLQLAAVSGVDLEQAVMQKIALNHKRVWQD